MGAPNCYQVCYCQEQLQRVHPMRSDPSCRLVAPPPTRAKRPSLRIAFSAVAICLGCPAALYLDPQQINDGSVIYYLMLVIVGSVWAAAAYYLVVSLFLAASGVWSTNRIATVTGIFLGCPILFAFGVYLAGRIEHPSWVDYALLIPGLILWFGSCHGIYDVLFLMVEARWPAAKDVRKVIGSLFKILISHYRHMP
jgi:hypothetical protein